MNILFICDMLNIGGKEILLLDICKNVSMVDFNIFLISNGGDLEKKFQNSNAIILKSKRIFPIDLRYILFIRNSIKKFNIDIVHTHDSVSLFHAYLANLGLKKRMVDTKHGYINRAHKDNLVGKLLSKYIDANIIVSKSFFNELIRINFINDKSKKFIVHNGIDPGRILKGEGNLKKELKLRNDIFLMGMVANFTNGKDHITVCKSLPKIFMNIPNSYFVFIGGKEVNSPQLYDNCVELCKKNNILDRVFFLGKRSDIGNVLKSLDLFVFSSNTDAFCIAIIEAMIAGIPCLINDIQVFLEISSNGKYAFIFKKGDVQDFILKVLFLHKNLVKRCRIANDAQKWAMSNFSISKHISSLKEVYELLLNFLSSI